MKSARSFSWTGVFLFCLFAFLLGMPHATLLAQQAGAGEIGGQVVDPAGGAIRGAAVSITNTNTGQITPAKTDDQGHFSVKGLPAGSYTVDVSAASFAAASRTGVQVSTAQSQNLSIALQLASV